MIRDFSTSILNVSYPIIHLTYRVSKFLEDLIRIAETCTFITHRAKRERRFVFVHLRKEGVQRLPRYQLPFAYQLSFSGTAVSFGQTTLIPKLSKSAKLLAARAARAGPASPSHIH